MKVAPETTLYGIYIQLHEIRRKLGQIRDAIMTNGIRTVSNDVIVTILKLADEYETNALSAKMLLCSETNQPNTAYNMLARINHVTDTVHEYIDDIYSGVIMRRCAEVAPSDTTSSTNYQ
jgi:hypothetical protein